MATSTTDRDLLTETVLDGKRPRPRPAALGYHEVWHTLVVGASTCHFTLVLLLVGP
jgi:predicted membrane channel-forming protein YqfA (hemolysin III family)